MYRSLSKLFFAAATYLDAADLLKGHRPADAQVAVMLALMVRACQVVIAREACQEACQVCQEEQCQGELG